MAQSIEAFIDSLKFDAGGLIPAIVQDVTNKDVLMVAYMNREAVKKTITGGKATYFSRSRKKLWLKGETSGNFQHVRRLYFDCDRDTLLVEVEQVGVACHMGYRSCFYREAVIRENGQVEEEYCLQKPE